MPNRIWDCPLASAGGLLTYDECILLLKTDLDINDDLFKPFPNPASKVQPRDSIFPDDNSSLLYPGSPEDKKPNSSALASELLLQIEDQFKQENTFPNWFEEKVELPNFDHIPLPAVREETAAPSVFHSNSTSLTPFAALAPEPTDELLQEFETVYDAVELTHLTPPQTPPRSASQLLLGYASQAQQAAGAHFTHLTATAAPQPQWQTIEAPPAYTTLSFTPAVDFDSELKAAEEIVQMNAIGLPSPRHSAVSSPRHSADSFSSAPSSPRSSTDEEWSARPKPYSRVADDRRSRKKEQNKNAATRYRQKKKAEIEVLLNEESGLRQRHAELSGKCTDLQREIRYLKGLMRDLFKAKGLIK